MPFHSSVFLFVFLPGVFLTHSLLPKNMRNAMLAFASIFFYAWGELEYVTLLLLSIVITHVAGTLIHARRGSLTADVILAFHVLMNIGMLAYFKYASFLMHSAGFTPPNQAPHLPIGISFFTFQAVSYVIDVRRGHVQPQSRPINTALYISLFPQLIAGPIVRYKEIRSQLSERTIDLASVAEGVRRFVIGLAKKVLVADTLAAIPDATFSSTALSPQDAWIGAVCFGLQIYFDFSGYSDMAIGLGRMFGFRLPENFNLPYVSTSIGEFWRRWHITLMNWFKDYVYIPLGGNRHGVARATFNVLFVFALSGLWHGAAWTFALWGVWFGMLIACEKTWKHMKLPTWKRAGHAYVILATVFGWTLFRSPDITFAAHYSATMLRLGSGGSESMITAVLTTKRMIVLTIALIWCTPLFARTYHMASQSKDAATTLLRDALLIGVFTLCLMELAISTYTPFIYFQF